MKTILKAEVPTDLLEAAKAIRNNAYAPYSNYLVGAALRSKNGAIYSGANIENSSYGLTRCAEQSVIQAMASAGERDFTELVVYTESTPAASPCGACRQILFEFSRTAMVYLVNHTNKVTACTLAELLPAGFHMEDI